MPRGHEPQMRRHHPGRTSIKKATYLGLLLFALLTDLISQPAGAISNGEPVPEDDPIKTLTVSLYGNDEDCTGVKIAANLILTARYCNLDKSSRAIFHYGGSYNILWW